MAIPHNLCPQRARGARLLEAIVLAVAAFCIFAAMPASAWADARPANPADEGEYLLSYQLLKPGTQEASHVDGVFDAHVKLQSVAALGEDGVQLKNSDGKAVYERTVSLLIPAGTEVLGVDASDAVSQVAICAASADGQEMAYKAAVRTETEEGVLYSELPVDDVSAVQKIRFTLSTQAGPHEQGAPLEAELVFTGMTTWWPGFQAQAPANRSLANGVYAMDITAWTGGSVDAATNTTSFGKPLMGDGVFGDTMWVTVKNGTYTFSVNMQEVSNSYVRNIREYTKAGNYQLDPDPDQALVNVKTLSYQRGVDGALYADEDAAKYSKVVSFSDSSKGASFYKFLRFLITSRAPVAGSLEKTPFVIMMEWDTLRKAELPKTKELAAAISAAKELDKDGYTPETWAKLRDCLLAAQETQKTSYALSQGEVDARTQALLDAQAALAKVQKPAAKAQKLTGKASITKAMGAKPFALGVASDAEGAKFSYKTSNAKVATVDAKGRVTLKGAGTCKVTVTSTAPGCQKATKAVTVKATLAKAALTKATKSSAKGKVTAAWKKVAGAQGYQVKVGGKTYGIAGAKALKKTVKASAGKKVKVQVRAYSKASGAKVYGKWSKAKTVSVKKWALSPARMAS